ncbi:MAG: hypothetical protein OZ929_22630 [Bryobacterales bacterium]|nr:hypothetical protein [Bryobacterales bacterium]
MAATPPIACLRPGASYRQLAGAAGNITTSSSTALTSAPLDPREPETVLAECARKLCSVRPGIRMVISTGRRGAFGFDGGRWDWRPAPGVRHAGAASAGDVLLAGVVCGLAAGMPFIHPGSQDATRPLATALDPGVMLAALSVTSPHTIHLEANLETFVSFAEGMGVNCSPLQAYVQVGALA